MAITASDVNALRQKTGVGMMDCKKALTEANGDMDKAVEILREKGMDERLVHAVVSHGYLLTVDVQPEHQMEKVLYATDELTGLIGAVVRMLPTKSVQDLQLKSLKKKFKDKKFASGCSREVIERGADMLGWSLDELMERTINAMQASPAANGN